MFALYLLLQSGIVLIVLAIKSYEGICVTNELQGYQFSDYFLSLKDKALHINNRQLPLSERMFLFLYELLKASPALVTKEQLHRVLWSDRQVSDWALARIVSDTRLLLENNANKTKEYIKTARGIGYSIVGAQAVYADDKKEVNKSVKQYLWVVSAVILLIVVVYQVNNIIKQQQLIEAVSTLVKNQDYSYRAFKAQALRRNELVAQIEKRLNIKRQRQFEKFFAHYFEQMNKEELFIFSQIRAITTESLYKANKIIYDTLENNPDIYHQIPKTKTLAEHLKFWLNKYQAIFLQRNDMCLLYVGVEDGVPYPSHVDQLIKDWLKNNKI